MELDNFLSPTRLGTVNDVVNFMQIYLLILSIFFIG